MGRIIIAWMEPELSATRLIFVRSPFDKRNLHVYRQMAALVRREEFFSGALPYADGGVMARLAAHVTGTGAVIYTAHGFHF